MKKLTFLFTAGFILLLCGVVNAEPQERNRIQCLSTDNRPLNCITAYQSAIVQIQATDPVWKKSQKLCTQGNAMSCNQIVQYSLENGASSPKSRALASLVKICNGTLVEKEPATLALADNQLFACAYLDKTEMVLHDPRQHIVGFIGIKNLCTSPRKESSDESVAYACNYVYDSVRSSQEDQKLAVSGALKQCSNAHPNSYYSCRFLLLKSFKFLETVEIEQVWDSVRNSCNAHLPPQSIEWEMTSSCQLAPNFLKGPLAAKALAYQRFIYGSCPRGATPTNNKFCRVASLFKTVTKNSAATKR